MEEEDEAMGIPEWVVTFGDMMSLLLTFFIMLVSMSEIKEEEKFQAIVESVKQHFGHDKSMESITPGHQKVRSQAPTLQSTMGRAKKKDTHRGGVPTKAPQGEEERVRIVRPGRNTAIGTVIFFQSGETDLSERAKEALDSEVEQLVGKPQKIEIRGHAGQELAGDPKAAFQLGTIRAQAVFTYLQQQYDVHPSRMRVSSAGSYEPMHMSNSSEEMEKNQRVEVFLLEETVADVQGTPEERQQRIVTNSVTE